MDNSTAGQGPGLDIRPGEENLEHNIEKAFEEARVKNLIWDIEEGNFVVVGKRTKQTTIAQREELLIESMFYENKGILGELSDEAKKAITQQVLDDLMKAKPQSKEEVKRLIFEGLKTRGRVYLGIPSKRDLNDNGFVFPVKNTNPRDFATKRLTHYWNWQKQFRLTNEEREVLREGLVSKIIEGVMNAKPKTEKEADKIADKVISEELRRYKITTQELRRDKIMSNKPERPEKGLIRSYIDGLRDSWNDTPYNDKLKICLGGLGVVLAGIIMYNAFSGVKPRIPEHTIQHRKPAAQIQKQRDKPSQLETVVETDEVITQLSVEKPVEPTTYETPKPVESYVTEIEPVEYAEPTTEPQIEPVETVEIPESKPIEDVKPEIKPSETPISVTSADPARIREIMLVKEEIETLREKIRSISEDYEKVRQEAQEYSIITSETSTPREELPDVEEVERLY